ncbi:hypothetical protein pb186bvf_004791 [Paramecium bursaria]
MITISIYRELQFIKLLDDLKIEFTKFHEYKRFQLQKLKMIQIDNQMKLQFFNILRQQLFCLISQTCPLNCNIMNNGELASQHRPLIGIQYFSIRRSTIQQ